MGLDIHINTNNLEELNSAYFYGAKPGDYFYQHRLSRTFCNLLWRYNVVSHEPELKQIGKITGVNITPILEMENYPDEDELSYMIESIESEEERQKLLKKAEDDKAYFQGNINMVLSTITQLIEKLNLIDNLPFLLLPTENDTLRNEEYFSSFKTDTGVGYIGNNFGQDLRNFKRFLEFVKDKDTTTVWFSFG